MNHSTTLLSTSLLAFILAACGGKYVGSGDEPGALQPDRANGSSGGSQGQGEFGEPTPDGVGAEPPIGPGLPGVGIGGQASSPHTGPLTGCNLVHQFNEASFCEQARECDNGYSYTSCDGDNCSCEVPGGYVQLAITSSSTESQCSNAHNVCQEFLEASGTVPTACMPGYLDQGNGYCSASEECTRSIELSHGTATQYLWRESWCEGNTCECYSDGAQGSVRIEFAREITGIDDCKSTLEVCSGGSVLPPAGTACQPRYQSADSAWCDMELECSHPSTIGNDAVTVFNYQHAGCQRGSGDNWDCWCSGRAVNVESSTGWDACSQLADLCTL